VAGDLRALSTKKASTTSDNLSRHISRIFLFSIKKAAQKLGGILSRKYSRRALDNYRINRNINVAK
jgi:hypothetical protein